MAKRVSKKVKVLDKLSDRAKKISAIVSAVVVVVGALSGIFGWVSSQFTDAVSRQISGFQQEFRNANLKNEQAVTRVELMILMEHDPENVVAIEKMAKYYFQELDGDLYLTQKYSEWAKQYGGDTTIVVGGK